MSYLFRKERSRRWAEDFPWVALVNFTDEHTPRFPNQFRGVRNPDPEEVARIYKGEGRKVTRIAFVRNTDFVSYEVEEDPVAAVREVLTDLVKDTDDADDVDDLITDVVEFLFTNYDIQIKERR